MKITTVSLVAVLAGFLACIPGRTQDATPSLQAVQAQAAQPGAATATTPTYSPTAVTIGWGLSPSTNIVSQTVAWGTVTTNYTQFMGLANNVTTYQITGLQPATTYYIAIFCTQSVGTPGTNLIKSVYSPEIVWTTAPSDRPLPPVNPKVIASP